MLLDIEEPGKANEIKEKPEIIVGIDFGTTNSLVSYFDGEDIIEIPIDQNEMLKSSAYVEGTEVNSIKRAFGKSLEEIKSGNFLNEDLKEKFDKDESGNLVLNLAGKNIYPIEVASKIFKRLKLAATRTLGENVSKAVVTVPAYFDDASKDMVKKSAQLAGIEVVRLLAEPTSAAYFYGLDTKSEGNYVVYDLGGGTFDVSILKMQMGAFQVISTGGDSLLGGDDIDLEISKFLSSKFKKFNELDKENQKEISKILKEILSDADVDEAEVDEFYLSKDELYDLTKDIIAQTIRITKKTIYDSKIKDFSGIILVGGTTRLNGLKNRIKEEFENIKIIDEVNPDKIVCFGAAKQGYNLSHKNGDLLIDAIPLSLGIELYGGLTEKILHRNSPIPSTKTVKYTTKADNQTGMDFHIVQGDRELAKNCRSLAKFKLSGIPPMVAGMAQIEVTFKIDADGLLSISAKELSTGAAQHIEVKPTFGLDEEIMYEMLKNAVENSGKDFEISKKISYKLDLESSLEKLEKLLDKNRDLLNDDEYSRLKRVCVDFSIDLDEKTTEELEELDKKLEKETSFFVERIMNKGLDVHIKGKNLDEITGNKDD